MTWIWSASGAGRGRQRRGRRRDERPLDGRCRIIAMEGAVIADRQFRKQRQARGAERRDADLAAMRAGLLRWSVGMCCLYRFRHLAMVVMLRIGLHSR